MRTRNLLTLLLTLLIASATFAQSAKVKGRVMDTSGSIMPGVQVKLSQGDKVVGEALTTGTGEFELPANPGDYKLEVTAPDFNTFTEMVKVTPDMGVLSVTMELATFSQNVEVTETRNEISIDSDSSLSTTVLKQDFIDALPDDETELEAYLSQIAGARGGAGGGATFIVDGFTGGRVPPKDQIQEIRINNNPFSSEFSGIGYGRTEIITKAGTGEYHGNMNIQFRDESLNARDPFLALFDPVTGLPVVAKRPPSQQRNFQTNFSGPIIRNKLSLNLNARHNFNQNSDSIRAFLPDATGNPFSYSASVVHPNQNKQVNARSQYAINKNNTLFVNYTYQHQLRQNQGPGTFTLEERAFDSLTHSTEVQLRETAILTKSIVHEFRFEYSKDYSQTTPRNLAYTINVLDSFNRGGAQNNSVSNNRQLEFDNMLMYSGAKWTIKSGFQGLKRNNHSQQQNNFIGTFTFSSLADFNNNKPLQFTQTTGNPLLDDGQFETSMFVQTDYKMTKKLNLSLGTRYEVQTNISDHNNLDPRAGLAYELTKTMALRAGAGIFHQRFDIGINENLLRLDPNAALQQQIIISFPSYPNPFVNGTAIATPPSIRTRTADLATPYTANASVSLEKTLPKNLGLTFSWDYQRGTRLYRSRDVNAPLPGSGITPDPTKGVVYQLESTGISKSNNFTLGFRQQIRNKLNVQLFGNYTLGYQKNNTDGWQSTPVNSYDMSSEWGRSGNDIRHRFFTGAQFRLPAAINMTTQINWSSSRPYNIVTGHDDNLDKVINDRPTDTALCQAIQGKNIQTSVNCASPMGQLIGRNVGIGPGQFNIQLNLQKSVRLKGESKGPANRAGNGSPTGVNNFLPPQRGGGGGGNFPGGGNQGGGDRGGNQGGERGAFGGQRNGQNGNNNQPYTGPTMVIQLNAQNLLNNVQYANYSGTMTSSFFGRANGVSRQARMIEAGIRFNF